MSANTASNQKRIAPTMMTITLFAGLTGFAYQIMQDGAMLTFLVTIAALGGLVGSSKGYDERDRQLLWQSYARAFEILFLGVYLVYIVVMLAAWLNIGSALTGFINTHWISMLASSMCIILGAVGIRTFHDSDN